MKVKLKKCKLFVHNGITYERDDIVDVDENLSSIKTMLNMGEIVSIENQVSKDKPKKEESKEVPKDEPKEEEKPVEESKDRAKELKDLSKDEQIEIIKNLDPEADIPRFEKDRVNLILELENKN